MLINHFWQAQKLRHKELDPSLTQDRGETPIDINAGRVRPKSGGREESYFSKIFIFLIFIIVKKFISPCDSPPIRLRS